MIEFPPEKSKKVALARLDLLSQWKEFRRKSENKLQADYNFVNLHNTTDATFRRYANWFKKNNYDKWVLARDGEKALSDKVEPYIKRDASLLEVGDILVADGHVLNFNVINPFTGKPIRATLVGFLDWKSTALVGYEIMLEENTQ